MRIVIANAIVIMAAGLVVPRPAVAQDNLPVPKRLVEVPLPPLAQGKQPFPLKSEEIPTEAIAEQKPRLPKSRDELAIAFSIQEALEEGPIVCTVTLKNVCKDTLKYADSSRSGGAYCDLQTNWKHRTRPPIVCLEDCLGSWNIGGGWYELRAGETISETVYLHKEFLSIPSGKVTVRFGWRLYKPAEKQEKNQLAPTLEKLFELEGEQTIEIKPATANNLALVLRNLEAEFAEIVDSVEREQIRPENLGFAAARWVKTIDGCRHKEFVPLLTKGLGLLHGWDHTRRLLATIYESFAITEEGFAVLANYLSSGRPVSALDVFEYWVHEDTAYARSEERQAELRKPLSKEAAKDKKSGGWSSREMAQYDEENWKSSKRHLDIRRTKDQFGRLLSIKDVRVRALLYAHFPDKCPADWVETLFKDLRKAVQPPEGLAELVAKLDHNNFKVREQATRELIESCTGFLRHLAEVPEDKLSLEAKERLKSVRITVQQTGLPPLWQSAIRYLAWKSEPHNQKMLDTLRKSDCRNLISDAAQNAYDDVQKQRERFAPTPESKKPEEKK